MDYEKILEIIKKLKDSAKRKLIKDIFILLVSKEKQNNCAELVCPHCNSKYIVKNGKNKDKQRYKCKSCRKSFITETNTPIYYSKKDITICFLYSKKVFLAKPNITNALNEKKNTVNKTIDHIKFFKG